MIGDVLAHKMREYAPANAIEQESVLAELLQHYVLASLSRAGFFREAEFHGGTCLRIVHGMERFSEDLDFLLKRSDQRFAWRNYLDQVVRDCAADGIKFEVLDKSEASPAVRKAFLKTESIGQLLVVDLAFSRQSSRKLRIKLEVDTNPPAGSVFETSYITFPTVAALTTQTLPSSFALKSHALLCRSYVKGRDWYDFLWYVSRAVHPNLALLSNAIDQQGPWAGQQIEATASWYLERLEERISGIDWQEAAMDVRRFLRPRQQEGLDLWSTQLFHFHVEKLKRAILASP